MFIAVTSYSKDRYGYAVITDDFRLANSGVATGDAELLMLVQSGLSPINFSVQNGKVLQDCGSFDRLESNEGVAVVLAEIRSKTGILLGYCLLSCSSFGIANMRRVDVIKKSENRRTPFIQNAILRNNTINCYPHKKFNVITVQTNSGSKPVSAPVERPKMVSVAPSVRRELDSDQKLELARCSQRGIDPSFINDPNLNKEQMRVLWVSKSKGALAEYFNNPKLSSDVMKFYADRIYSKKLAKECELMLQHPELSTDQLAELYLCISDGVDYSDLLDKSPVDIRCERESRSRAYWGKSLIENDRDYLEKALAAAAKL